MITFEDGADKQADEKNKVEDGKQDEQQSEGSGDNKSDETDEKIGVLDLQAQEDENEEDNEEDEEDEEEEEEEEEEEDMKEIKVEAINLELKKSVPERTSAHLGEDVHRESSRGNIYSNESDTRLELKDNEYDYVFNSYLDKPVKHKLIEKKEKRISTPEKKRKEISKKVLDSTKAKAHKSGYKIFEGSEITPRHFEDGTDPKKFSNRHGSRNYSVIMRVPTVKVDPKEDKVNLDKRGFIIADDDYIESLAKKEKGDAYYPLPPEQVSHFKGKLDESNAVYSENISEMPSSYIRVHKPHKNEVYILDGHKKYPDGTFEKGKICIEHHSDSRYLPETVNTKKSRIMPFEDISRYTADHRQLNESPTSNRHASNRNVHHNSHTHTETKVTHFDYQKSTYAKNHSGAVGESPKKSEGFYMDHVQHVTTNEKPMYVQNIKDGSKVTYVQSGTKMHTTSEVIHKKVVSST